ncbi:GNAT family N-acetyltransferase [Phenylobacterium sp.]|uniref:GNAT family N-acetyltransferase n=1 Tax=Phenylobacterium sp. TaxID=1871053 RepID=UPI0025EDB16C|nr:GNAT family N-acetyltransferase [Phenylobacterium sp.]
MCAIEVRPSIGTDRLVLRGPVAGDAPAITELANDPGVVGMLQTWPYPYELTHAEAWLAKVGRADPACRTDFVVEHRQFGVMGVVGVGAKDPARPELGYWLGRPFWGRGYATEAVSATLDWVKAGWRKKVVWAGHFADNAASGQVLCKAGFLYTGDVVTRPSLGRGGAATPSRMMVWLA